MKSEHVPICGKNERSDMHTKPVSPRLAQLPAKWADTWFGGVPAESWWYPSLPREQSRGPPGKVPGVSLVVLGVPG